MTTPESQPVSGGEAESNEEFYDREIAPALAALATKCEGRGMSFIAEVEYQAPDSGTTSAIAANASMSMRMIYALVKAHGNLDAFLMSVTRHAKEHGHGSAYLSMLGIPVTPKPVEKAAT